MDRKGYEKKILELREKLYGVYVSYDKYVQYIFRFALAFLVFGCINKCFPYQETLSSTIIIVVSAVVGACLPDSLFVIMAVVLSVAEIYFLSPVLAVAILIGSIFLYVMFLRYSPKTILFAALFPVAVLLKIPALLAILIGLFFSPMGVLTVGGGTFCYYMFLAVKQCETVAAEKSGKDIITLVRYFVDEIMQNQNMYVMVLSLCAVTLLTYFVRVRKMAFSFEISIVLAAVAHLIILLLGNLLYDSSFSVAWAIGGNIISAVFAYLTHFFHMVLDYGSMEEVQFEDEDYYYYVRAVPKLKMTMEKKRIKKM